MNLTKRIKHAAITFLFVIILMMFADMNADGSDNPDVIYSFKEIRVITETDQPTLLIVGINSDLMMLTETNTLKHDMQIVSSSNNVGHHRSDVKDIIDERQQINAQIDSITADPYDITKISNLTEDQYYALTKDTWWEGHEQTLIELEKKYKINAMYAMSVSTLESYYGTSNFAKTRNNYYGAHVDTIFDGLHDCTMYFGDFQNRLYVEEGLVNVYDIGPVYCPPNRNWEVYVSNKMTELLNKTVSTLK